MGKGNAAKIACKWVNNSEWTRKLYANRQKWANQTKNDYENPTTKICNTLIK